MTQTSNRFFDEAARLMNDAAGVAQGVRREFDTMLRHQAERILGEPGHAEDRSIRVRAVLLGRPPVVPDAGVGPQELPELPDRHLLVVKRVEFEAV